MDQCWLAMIVGGSVIAASSMRRPSIGRTWLAAAGLACVTAGFLCHSGSWRLSTALDRMRRFGGEPVNDAIDTALADSFPASDAPASIPAAGTTK